MHYTTAEVRRDSSTAPVTLVFHELLSEIPASSQEKTCTGGDAHGESESVEDYYAMPSGYRFMILLMVLIGKCIASIRSTSALS